MRYLDGAFNFDIAAVDIAAVNIAAVNIAAVDIAAVDIAAVDIAAVDIAAVDIAADTVVSPARIRYTSAEGSSGALAGPALSAVGSGCIGDAQHISCARDMF